MEDRGGVQQKANVFLFIPNLISYFRIILTLVSFYFMMEDPIATAIAYAISAALDAVDGMAARYFNQSSRLGAMMDQLTDRISLMGLCATLSSLYPRHSFLFLLSMAIDIGSHWAHIWSTLIHGKASHKTMDESENPILRIYYSSRIVLFAMCAGNEMFYGFLYLLYFYADIQAIEVVVYVTAPIAVIKSLISVIQLTKACTNFAVIDLAEVKDRK